MLTGVLFTSEDRGVVSATIGADTCRKRVISMVTEEQKEVFVINHCKTLNDSNWPRDNLHDVQRYTEQLTQTAGRYFRLHGRKACPFEMLVWMEEHGFHFERDCRRLKVRKSVSGFTDISGNLLEYSAAFHYRFYHQESLDKWLELAFKLDPKSKELLD